MYMPQAQAQQVRIIAVLREPASRLLSYYEAFGANGVAFEEFVQQEILHWKENNAVWGYPVRDYSQMTWDCAGLNSCQAHVPPLHLLRGMYDLWISSWSAKWPRGQNQIEEIV